MEKGRNEYTFDTVPTVSTQRSTFARPTRTVKTTCNVGSLIPLIVDTDVLPGQTTKASFGLVARTTTPKTTVMDTMYADLYAFAVPWRILWTHFKEFLGENTTGTWAQTTEYTIPCLKTADTTMVKGTIWDYFNLPTGIANLSIPALAFRAYCLIWNDWFRDQNYMAPVTIPLGDDDVFANADNAITGGKPLPVCKFHDYFTSLLPAPQKGAAETLPLGTSAPILVSETPQNTIIGGKELTWTNTITGDLLKTSGGNVQPIAINNAGSTQLSAQNVTGGSITLAPRNLYADLAQATASTMNALRIVGAGQRNKEKDARGGTRVTEIYQNHFGVSNPDGRMQRPEYLGGKRIPVEMQQVAQTSATSGSEPLGTTSAYSQTIDTDGIYVKSFTEHTIVMYLVAIRYTHSYQQGIERQWLKKRKYDLFWPSFANIGEVPAYKSQIRATGTDADNEVLGYQEPWVEYKVKPNVITGAMRSTYATPLDMYHYADYYTTTPVISADFIAETPSYVDRTLTMNHTVEDQFKIDFALKETVTMPMPLHSVPGFFDHF